MGLCKYMDCVDKFAGSWVPIVILDEVLDHYNDLLQILSLFYLIMYELCTPKHTLLLNDDSKNCNHNGSIF